MALLNTNIGPERVQAFDVPLCTVQLPGTPTAVTGILISTSFVGAPVNSPTKVTNLADFEASFGTADDILYDGYYAVQGFFDNAGNGNTAIIVNVGTSPTSSSWIGSASAGTGLRALGSEDVLGLVAIPGLPLEQAYLVHSALIDYTETVRAEFGATLSTSFSLLGIPKEITKANTDVVQAITAKFVSVSGTGPYVIQLDDGLGGPVNISAAKPGMLIKNVSGSFEAVISAVNDGTDQITIIQNPGANFSAGNDVLFYIPSAVTYKEFVVNNPSRVAS